MKTKKTVVLGVTGSIAAYKACEIVRSLRKADVEVFVILTRAAEQFVSKLTFESLSNHPVAIDLFSRDTPWEIEHISLAKRADLFLVAPASMNFIAKYAHGIADDMLTTTIQATTAPVLIAPAMNDNMYASFANQENLKILSSRGCNFVSPQIGLLACGDVGIGKLAEFESIVEKALELLEPISQDYVGKRVLISAGPTRESIDPVRYITNHSSGKMGYALANVAKKRGASVTLVSGPVNLPVPEGVRVVPVESTEDMLLAMQKEFEDCDICIKAAAPADFRSKVESKQKIKKLDRQGFVLELEQTPDIIQTLCEAKKTQFVCGFAAETNDVVEYARKKLKKKNLDMIVANDVSRQDIGFHSDQNAVTIFSADGSEKNIEKADKSVIANAIFDEILQKISRN